MQVNGQKETAVPDGGFVSRLLVLTLVTLKRPRDNLLL
jgi:hypothetical protein